MVKDDGVGMGNLDINEDSDGSLGMELIKGLARDLNGELSIDSKQGMAITLHFKLNSLEDTMLDMQTTGKNAQAHIA
jgi:two-component sensor histidine kinase